MAARLQREERGQKSTGPVPKPPRSEPDPKEQTNFTDPESRIMKSGNGCDGLKMAPEPLPTGCGK
ncbi:MAG: hypothetical protein WD941_01810 [Opitutus sp.]